MKKTKLALLGMILGMALCLSGCKVGNTEFVMKERELDNKTLFAIGEERCTSKEAYIYLCNYKNIYGTAYGMDLSKDASMAEDLNAYARDVALAEYYRVSCMRLLAVQEGIELDEEDKKLVDNCAKLYYQSLSQDDLAFMGVSEADLVEAYTHYALAMKLFTTLTEGVNLEVSDDDARVVHAQVIYLTNKDNATIVENAIANDKDFGNLSLTYHEAGDYDVYMTRGSYPEAVERAAYDLSDGEVSSMIETEDGYYFVKCLSKYEKELTEENKVAIQKQRQRADFDQKYQEYITEVDDELNEEVWEAFTLEGADAVTTDQFFRIFDEQKEY